MYAVALQPVYWLQEIPILVSALLVTAYNYMTTTARNKISEGYFRVSSSVNIATAGREGGREGRNQRGSNLHTPRMKF